ncbi:MAG: CBS domain-containing protein [Alphaproteobacteria bacterium]
MARKILPDVIGNQRFICELTRDGTARQAAELMAERRVGAVLVTKSGTLEGIFTERDLATRVVAKGRDPNVTKLSDVMTKNPDVLAPDDPAEDALTRMRAGDYRHMPVMDGNRIVGIVSIRDLYAEVHKQLENDLKDRDAFIFGSGFGGLS